MPEWGWDMTGHDGKLIKVLIIAGIDERQPLPHGLFLQGLLFNLKMRRSLRAEPSRRWPPVNLLADLGLAARPISRRATASCAHVRGTRAWRAAAAARLSLLHGAGAVAHFAARGHLSRLLVRALLRALWHAPPRNAGSYWSSNRKDRRPPIIIIIMRSIVSRCSASDKPSRPHKSSRSLHSSVSLYLDIINTIILIILL